jgi:hypothetical protein
VAEINFTIDLTLNGVSYPAARDNTGGRQASVAYVPKIKNARLNDVGEPTLDPLEYVSFNRGAGSSRNIGIDNMVAWGENVWTCEPGLLMPGPAVTQVPLPGATLAPRPDGVSEADGNIYVAAGRYVYCLTGGQEASPAPTQDLDLGSNGTAGALRRFHDSLFLTWFNGGIPGLLFERPNGGTWVNTPLGTLSVQPSGALGRVWWSTGGVTTERLVAQFGPRGIRYCGASPRLDTNWTPAVDTPAIDSGSTGFVTRFATTLSHLYIATTSGLLDLDATGVAPNLVPEAEVQVFPFGGLAAMAAEGFVYYSAAYNLYRVDATGTYASVEVVTPCSDLPNETPVTGYGTALVKYGTYLIYAQYDAASDTTWICFGRGVTAAETRSLFSNTQQQISPQQYGSVVWNVAPIVFHNWHVTALHVSGLSSDGPRLWMFGTTKAGVVSARWAPLAFSTPYADLKAGRARGFAQSSFVVLPSEDGGDDAIMKDIEEVLNESENLGGGNSLTVSARREDEITFTQLGKFTSGPRAIAQIGDAFLTSRPTFRIDLVGTPASPPISRRVSIRWLPNPDRREVRRYSLQVGRAQQYAGGEWSGYGAEESVDNLTRLATGATRATLVDEINRAYNVRVLKLDGPTEYQAAESNDRVLVMNVTLSIFGLRPGPSFAWDQGTGYDSGHSWS